MTRLEALFCVFVGLLMLTAGGVWMFGPYGLFGGGVLAIVWAFVGDVKEDGDG